MIWNSISPAAAPDTLPASPFSRRRHSQAPILAFVRKEAPCFLSHRRANRRGTIVPTQESWWGGGVETQQWANGRKNGQPGQGPELPLSKSLCRPLCTHTHRQTHAQIALKRHQPSCDQEAFRAFLSMNIKYKHFSQFSTPGPYFRPLSWNNKHISFPLPDSVPKMNLSRYIK